MAKAKIAQDGVCLCWALWTELREDTKERELTQAVLIAGEAVQGALEEMKVTTTKSARGCHRRPPGVSYRTKLCCDSL